MHQTRQELEDAMANAQRGHRITEWEDVASALGYAARAYIDHVEAKRAEAPKGLQQMQDEVTAWCERKGWKGEGSAPVTFGDTMALLHSEVSEALEAYRDWGLADATGPDVHPGPCVRCAQSGVGACDDAPHPLMPAKPEGIGSEFADVLIRLLDDCDRWGVDLAFEYERKMAYNEKRPYQHGGRAL